MNTWTLSERGGCTRADMIGTDVVRLPAALMRLSVFRSTVVALALVVVTGALAYGFWSAPTQPEIATFAFRV